MNAEIRMVLHTKGPRFSWSKVLVGKQGPDKVLDVLGRIESEASFNCTFRFTENMLKK